MPVDYIIDPSLSPAGNRYQSFAALSTALGGNKNRTTVNLGRPTEIRIDTNLAEDMDWAPWTADATNSIRVYGLTQAVKITPGAEYGQGHVMPDDAYVSYEDLEFDGTGFFHVNGLRIRTHSMAKRLKIHGYAGSNNYEGQGIQNLGGRMEFVTAWDCRVNIQFSQYYASIFINCTATKAQSGGKGFAGGNNNHTMINCVSFGNPTNWSIGGSFSSYTLARNNAGESGDSVPDTVGSTALTTITSSDFFDYTANDFHLSSTSRLRHTHASYPTGNNQYSGVTLDVDSQALPSSYATDADRWDTGSDFFVVVVTGTVYYRDTDLSAVATSSSVKRASDDAAFTINDLVIQDTIEIRSGAKVHIKDNGTAAFDFLVGTKLNVVNGELWMENALTTKGQTFLGVKGGALTIGARGKFYARGTLVLLADLSDSAYASVRTLNHSEWDTMWGTGSKDSNGNYGSPGIIFVGTSSGTAVPYFNESDGTTVGDLANDATHGRTFRFAPSTGVITWPDLVPGTTEKVYCYNIMVHSKDGQSTPALSFNVDTTGKGGIDAEKLYFTGSPYFKDANGCRLAGLGIVLPLTVDHCSGVVLDVYQGISQGNEQLGTNLIKNLKNEASIGTVYGFNSGTVLKLQKLRSCSFTKIGVEGFGAQSGSYRMIVDGTDDCDFGTVDLIDGGMSFEGSISINPIIRVLNHSNDQSGSNGNNSQHLINGASTGTRNLRVEKVNLMANGFPTALDLFNVNNAGKARFLDITYNATIRNILSVEDSFDVMVSKGSIGRCTAQGWKAVGSNSQIVVQGIKNTTSPSSPPAFVEYIAEDVLERNFPYETSDRYTGWTLPITDLNFMELSLGNASTGKLVLNFYQSTKGIFTFTGLGSSNNSDAVLLPAVSDSVVVEWPYDILVGSASPYFTTTTMVLVGTNTSNLTYEYAININGAGYGSYATLTAAALNALSVTTKFRIKFRVTCATASATNAIKQIILSTNIDSTVEYPSATYTLTLTGMQDDTEVRIYDQSGNELTGIEDVGATGIFSYTYDYFADFIVDIQIMHLGYVFQRFNDFPLTSADKTQLIQQNLDRTYANP